eukprot:4166918-Amphidinium_carterae.1
MLKAHPPTFGSKASEPQRRDPDRGMLHPHHPVQKKSNTRKVLKTICVGNPGTTYHALRARSLLVLAWTAICARRSSSLCMRGHCFPLLWVCLVRHWSAESVACLKVTVTCDHQEMGRFFYASLKAFWQLLRA